MVNLSVLDWNPIRMRHRVVHVLTWNVDTDLGECVTKRREKKIGNGRNLNGLAESPRTGPLWHSKSTTDRFGPSNVSATKKWVRVNGDSSSDPMSYTLNTRTIFRWE